MTKLFGTFSLIKAPILQTIQFVNYHSNAGANPILLFFDDPNDEAVDVVSQLPGVVATRCDEKFWTYTRKWAPQSIAEGDQNNMSIRQRLASVAAIRMARERQCQWLIHIDSDELLFPQHVLGKLLRETPSTISALRFPVLEALPPLLPQNGAFLDTRLFRSGERGCPPEALMPGWKDRLREEVSYNYHALSFRLRRRLATLMGLGRIFRDSYYKGHIQGKSAVRLDSGVVYMDPHYPSQTCERGLRVKTTERVKLLHFDCQGFDAWRKKWERRVLASYPPRNRKRLIQFESFSSLYRLQDHQGLAALFDKLYRLSSYEERVLLALGLIVQFDLQPEFFENETPDPTNDNEARLNGKQNFSVS